MKPELLAPAGSFEALKAAVANGADAVYFAGAKFNARRKAENFKGAQLEKAIAYCQKSNVKAYIAANTLVKNNELESAANYLRTIYENGADAAIIQDLGLLSMARELFPKLRIHASTQMTLTNSKSLAILNSLGVSRAVLPREFSLKDIKNASKNTSIELEYFVHGAMCFAYSGQCLMSSMIQNRSANRGLCTQFCRLPYTLQPGERHGYLMSMKDLSLGASLEELSKAGITSFKIEGRLKSPEYVAVAVREYRRAIDTGEYNEKQIARIFGRQYSNGYLYGPKDRTNPKRPDNQGISVGRIISYAPNTRTAKLRLTGDITQGDSIRIVASAKETGFTCRKSARKGKTLEIKAFFECKGANAYKTYDTKAIQQARKSYSNESAKTSTHKKRDAKEFNEKLAKLLQVKERQIDTRIIAIVQDKGAAQAAISAGADAAIINDQMAPAIIKDTELEKYKKAKLSGNLATGEYADYPLNITNRLSAQALSKLGFKRACISPELSLRDIGGFSTTMETEYIAHGRLVLMTTEHCFFREKCRNQCKSSFLKDRKGFIFPFGSKDCILQVYNSKKTALFDKAKALAGKVDLIRLDLREETKEEIFKLVCYYKELLSGNLSEASIRYKKALDMREFTTGHYLKDLE